MRRPRYILSNNRFPYSIAINFPDNDRPDRLCVSTKAMSAIAEQVGWGGQDEIENKPKSGLLSGSILIHPVYKAIVGFVSQAVRGNENEYEIDSQSEIIGWYYVTDECIDTLKLSPTQVIDNDVVRSLLFTVVVNPNRKMWRVYVQNRDDYDALGFVGSKWALRLWSRKFCFLSGFTETSVDKLVPEVAVSEGGNSKSAKSHLVESPSTFGFETHIDQLPLQSSTSATSTMMAEGEPIGGKIAGHKPSRFQVIEETKPYQLIPQNEPDYQVDNKLSSECRIKENSIYKLFLAPSAWEQISSHIGWGEETKHNIFEQGGLLLGNVFRDLDTDIVYGVVDKAVTGHKAQGLSTFIQFDHNTWKDMMDQLDEINAELSTDLQVIGWYHTHPKSLDVFMSGTDLNTQRRFFAECWHFALVMNPHRMNWRAFNGPDAIECSGYVISCAPSKPIEQEQPDYLVLQTHTDNPKIGAIALSKQEAQLLIKYILALKEEEIWENEQKSANALEFILVQLLKSATNSETLTCEPQNRENHG